MTPTPVYSVRIPEGLLARLKARAAREGTTMSDVVRRALREYVEEET